ncbi:hypothetical protein [Arcobacter sp.]|uniref:hypothetical protein n=2 Tax=Arcobacter sp. TaxID=1872629 RepID=UPI003D119F07
MKFIFSLFCMTTFLFASNFLSKEMEKILDIEETSLNKPNLEKENVIFTDKLSYKEFIEKRWEDDIEASESWGTEIMYNFYMLDTTKDIEKIIKSIKSNTTHLSNENIIEMKEQLDIKYNENLINDEEKNRLQQAINLAEIAVRQNSISGGGDSGGSSSGGHGDGGGHGGGDGD